MERRDQVARDRNHVILDIISQRTFLFFLFLLGFAQHLSLSFICKKAQTENILNKNNDFCVNLGRGAWIESEKIESREQNGPFGPETLLLLIVEP